MTTTVEVVHHKSVDTLDQTQTEDPEQSVVSDHHLGHQKHRRHSRPRASRCDSAQSRKSVPDSSSKKEPESSATDSGNFKEPFYPQSSLRQRSISFDSHQPLFDTNVVTTAGGTIVTTSALTVSDYTLNTSTRIPLKFGRYTHHHPHFYHHQVSRRPSAPTDVLARSGIDREISLIVKSELASSEGVKPFSSEPASAELKDMELMELRRSANNANYVVGSINNNVGRGNVTKISIEHRELPVDVPDSFVGVVKQAPRYPPPPPVTSSGTLTSMDSFASSSRKGSTTGSNRSDAIKVHPKVLSSSQSPASKERGKLIKYSDEMSRKQPDEQFVLSPSHESKKPQVLYAQQKLPSRTSDVVDYGGINPAFQSDEHDYENLGRIHEQNKG